MISVGAAPYLDYTHVLRRDVLFVILKGNGFDREQFHPVFLDLQLQLTSATSIVLVSGNNINMSSSREHRIHSY